MFDNLSDYEKARLFVSTMIYASGRVVSSEAAVVESEQLLEELGLVNPDLVTT